MKKGCISAICATPTPAYNPAAVSASPPTAGGLSISLSVTGSVFCDKTGDNAPLTNCKKKGHMAIK